MRAALLALALLAAPAYAGDRFYLEYHGVAWGVVPLGAASADVLLRSDTSAYAISAKLQSGGLLRLFDNTDIKASASGTIMPTGPEWTRYDLDHNYAKKRRVTAMWTEGGAVKTDVKPVWLHLGEPPATEDQKRAARDPLSSIVAMGVSMARTHKCAGDFRTFDGRHLYNLRFTGDPKPGHLKTDGYDGQVLKCTVYYEPMAGFDAKDMSKKRIPKAELWFALTDNPDFAPLVRAVLPLGLGNAGLELVQWRRAHITFDDATPTKLAPAP